MTSVSGTTCGNRCHVKA